MIRDLNSKIEFIEYDKLDHPICIQFMDGSNIQYVYAANGMKLKVTHQTAVDNLTVSANRKLDQPESQQKTTRLPAVDNTIVAADRKLDLSESQLKSQTVQYYMGNFVLTNGILDRYYFGSDGYAKFTNGKPVYSSRTKGYTYSTVNSSDVLLNPEYRVTQNVYPYYFVKDHLGSNRMVADNPSTMVSYYPYGGIYYDDILFYQADDSHLYNGKEMDRMYGLDTYDHGARQYNPARITWDRMDQLAEKYYNVSPYVYCAGNPIRFIDSNGLEPTPTEAARIANTLSFCIVPISQRTLFAIRVQSCNIRFLFFAVCGSDPSTVSPSVVPLISHLSPTYFPLIVGDVWEICCK